MVRKGRLPLLALTAIATAVAALACNACNRSGAKLRDAASADLNCPRNEVSIIGASRTKDVSGCGQRATYKFEDGHWVMVSREGAAPGGSPPTKAGPPPVAPPQPATGTPSMPPSSPPPPAPGQKSL
jgi:hypothetical protein